MYLAFTHHSTFEKFNEVTDDGEHGNQKKKFILPPARIELATFALQVQRSTTKLRRLKIQLLLYLKMRYVSMTIRHPKRS